MDPLKFFASDHYRRHNSRRLEHLAARFCRSPAAGSSNWAPGIGDHTGYFVDRGCEVTRVEGRGENLAVCARGFPRLRPYCSIWKMIRSPISAVGDPVRAIQESRIASIALRVRARVICWFDLRGPARDHL